MFWRVAAFYGYTDTHILQMPLYRFWSASKNVDRISAERRLADFRIASTAYHGDKKSGQELISELEAAKGTVAIIDQLVPDDNWDEKLKRMLGGN